MAQTKTKIGAMCALFGVGLIAPSLLSPDSSPARRSAIQFLTNPVFQTDVVAAKPAISSLPKRFQWASLESTDYREYVANLKAVGCPWETLKDIIIADLNSLYAKRIQALRRQEVENELVFWRTYDQQHRGSMRQRKEIGQIEKEKRDILRQLLGSDAETMTTIWGANEQIQADMQCVPVEKRGDVAELDSYYALLEQEDNAEGLFGMLEALQKTESFHDEVRDVLLKVAAQQKLEELKSELQNDLRPIK